MSTAYNPIDEHAKAYAKRALNDGGPKHRPHEYLDEQIGRYHSSPKRHEFLLAAKGQLREQYHEHLTQHHPNANPETADCGQREWFAKSAVLVEDRLVAIEEHRRELSR